MTGDEFCCTAPRSEFAVSRSPSASLAQQAESWKFCRSRPGGRSGRPRTGVATVCDDMMRSANLNGQVVAPVGVERAVQQSRPKRGFSVMIGDIKCQQPMEVCAQPISIHS